MRTRKTTFVAVLSQTLTTTSTFKTTSRSYPPSGNCDFDFDQRDGAAVTTSTTQLGGSTQPWCVECATPMVMMSPERAATLCFQTTRSIYRLVEAGRVHFMDGPEGVMVCPASLMKDWAGERNVQLLNS